MPGSGSISPVMEQTMKLEQCLALIRDVPDFPSPGIVFKDITPLLADGGAFRTVVDVMAERVTARGLTPDAVACPEARGFIFGAALAYRLGAGFVPIRKPRKLPHRTDQVRYALEYGEDALEIHVDACTPGHGILLVDDVLATGGTMGACLDLVRRRGARVTGCAFLLELAFLSGRARLGDTPVLSLHTLE